MPSATNPSPVRESCDRTRKPKGKITHQLSDQPSDTDPHRKLPNNVDEQPFRSQGSPVTCESEMAIAR